MSEEQMSENPSFEWAKAIRDFTVRLVMGRGDVPAGDTVDDPEVAALLASVSLQLRAAHEEVSALQFDGDLPFMTDDTLQNMAAKGDERSRKKATQAIVTRESVREWQNRLYVDDDDFDPDSWITAQVQKLQLGTTPAKDPDVEDIREKAARMRKDAEQPVKLAFERFRSAYSRAVTLHHPLSSSFGAAEDLLMVSVEMGQPDRQVARKMVQRLTRKKLSMMISHQPSQSRLTKPMFETVTYLLSKNDNDTDTRNKAACQRFVAYLLETVPLIPNQWYTGRGRQEMEYVACLDLTTGFVSFMRAPGFSAVVSVDDADKMKSLWAYYIQRCKGFCPPLVTTIVASLKYRCAFGKAKSDEADPLEHMISSERWDVDNITRQMRTPFPSKMPKYMLAAIEHARDRVVELRDGLGLKPDTDGFPLSSCPHTTRTYEAEMKRFVDVWADVMSTIDSKGKKRRAE